MKWGVPTCQRANSFHKYTRARTRIYFRKLLARWHTGTPLTFYSLSAHSPIPTPNSTIIKISPFLTFPCVFRVSVAGLPRVEGMSTHPEKVRLLRFAPRPAFQAPTGQHNPIMNRQGKKSCRASHTCKTAFSYRSITAAVMFDHAYFFFSSAIPWSKQCGSRWQKSSSASAMARSSTGVT